MGHNKSQNWYNSLSQRDKEKAQEFVYGSYSVEPVTGQQMDVMQKKCTGLFSGFKDFKNGKSKNKGPQDRIEGNEDFFRGGSL